MRAEGQAHIARIEAALSLVRQSLDWERALRRLDELNARVEDPTLWNDPKEAEAVMKERRKLEAAHPEPVLETIWGTGYRLLACQPG